jgi:hypothetical protein
LPQPIHNTSSRLIEGALVLKQIVIPVRSVHESVELECKLGGVDARVELAKSPRVPGLVVDRIEPLSEFQLSAKLCNIEHFSFPMFC